MNTFNTADPIVQKFSKVNEKIDALPDDTVNYIFVTDTHADEYLLRDKNNQLTVFEPEETVNNRIKQLAAHLEIAVNTANSNDHIDFIALGGDLINAYCTKGKDFVLGMLHKSLSPLKDCKKPVLIAFGNHDDNAFQTLNPDITATDKGWIISDKDWKDKVLDFFPSSKGRVHDINYEWSKYFYLDLPRKKTRIIVLDTMDCRRPFDENGTVTGEPQLKRICYTYEQLDWLVNQAFTTDAAWNYILISHMGIDSATNSNKMINGEILREIIKAYQNRTSYAFSYTALNGENITVSADYSENHAGRILFYSFGHQHSELITYNGDINLWQVSTGCENIRGGAGGPGSDCSLPWKILSGRQYGTESETCMDIISVSERICYKFNIGPGDDAEMPYPD